MMPNEDNAFNILVEVHRRLEDLRKESHHQMAAIRSDIKSNTDRIRDIGARVEETRGFVDEMRGPVEDWKKTSEAANRIAKSVTSLARVITTISAVAVAIATLALYAKVTGLHVIQYLRGIFPT